MTQIKNTLVLGMFFLGLFVGCAQATEYVMVVPHFCPSLGKLNANLSGTDMEVIVPNTEVYRSECPLQLGNPVLLTTYHLGSDSDYWYERCIYDGTLTGPKETRYLNKNCQPESAPMSVTVFTRPHDCPHRQFSVIYDRQSREFVLLMTMQQQISGYCRLNLNKTRIHRFTFYHSPLGYHAGRTQTELCNYLYESMGGQVMSYRFRCTKSLRQDIMGLENLGASQTTDPRDTGFNMPDHAGHSKGSGNKRARAKKRPAPAKTDQTRK